MNRKHFAEFVGTFWLVLGGCGSAVLASSYPNLGIGYLGVAIAFGLSLMTMAYAVGSISGAHFNPAVTIGLAAAGRFPVSSIGGYLVSQVLGAIGAAVVLYLIASGRPEFSVSYGFAANGYGIHSPGGYSLGSAMLCEIVLTAGFLIVVVGAISGRFSQMYGPLAIGTALALVHLISIPVTGTSVNPARSTGQALIVGGWAVQQLWMFWVAPIIGGLIGGTIAGVLVGEESQPTISSMEGGSNVRDINKPQTTPDEPRVANF